MWKKDQIIHTCPYEIIDEQGFQRYEGNILQGVRTQIAFEIQKKLTVCEPKPITIYSTSEGLYLMKKEAKYDGFILKKSNTQLSTSKFLMEADNDFNKIRQAKIYKEINTRNCYVLSNTLELAKLSLSDKYLKIRDVKGTELIL